MNTTTTLLSWSSFGHLCQLWELKCSSILFQMHTYSVFVFTQIHRFCCILHSAVLSSTSTFVAVLLLHSTAMPEASNSLLYPVHAQQYLFPCDDCLHSHRLACCSRAPRCSTWSFIAHRPISAIMNVSYALHRLLVRTNRSKTHCTTRHSFWRHIQPFLTIYDTARAFPTVASHCHALQIHVLVCEYFIWPLQIDPNDVYYRCRFYFRFSTYHPLQVLLFDHRWGHSLVAFWPYYWYILGLFCPIKLMALTYASVADSIFGISPFWPPSAPNTQQRLVVFISVL